ncbi:MAG: DUF5666 domain-containing protein [Candidatus Paceibacterota bacterium]
MSKKALLASGLVIISLMVSATAFAATTYSTKEKENIGAHIGFIRNKVPVVSGTVSAITGNNITLAAKDGSTYIIDATNSKITKNNNVTQLSNIAVGDTILVVGSLNGTNVVATDIIDGVFKQAGLFKSNYFNGAIVSISGSSFTIDSKGCKQETANQAVNTDSKTTFTKNGQAASFSDLAIAQRVVVTGARDATTNVILATNVNIIVNTAGTRFNGTVKSISGNNLIITDKNGTDYNVDATNAKITQGKNHNAAITAIKENDKVIIFGTQISGSTNIKANTIHDLSMSFKKD